MANSKLFNQMSWIAFLGAFALAIGVILHNFFAFKLPTFNSTSYMLVYGSLLFQLFTILGGIITFRKITFWSRLRYIFAIPFTVFVLIVVPFYVC